uniref:ABC transporter ATP-binding protein n=1 Tax=Desulfatirhabdium butyrativorans TaxID=340467 RepID=A0A7C4RQC1_9BACT
MALIEMQNIHKTYRMGETLVQALRGITLSIDAGEFVAVWGPSGSGKSTLLNLIGAIDDPDPSSESYRLQGQDIFSLSDNQRSEMRNRNIGFIFQQFNLIPVLSALENVMLPLQIQGVPTPKAREAALRRLEQVELKDFIDHRPDKLSGGQQQRVAIARALVTHPSLVIADEPTANLDTKTAMVIVSIMKELNRQEKTTFIFSTHDQRLIDHVDRLIHLEDGCIVEE